MISNQLAIGDKDAIFLYEKHTLHFLTDPLVNFLTFIYASRQVLISYGGLLMCLEGDPRQMQDLDIGKNFYLLMRKAN